VLGFLGPHGMAGFRKILAEDITIQKEQRGEDVIRCGRSDPAVNRQMGEKRLDRCGTHLLGMPFVVEG